MNLEISIIEAMLNILKLYGVEGNLLKVDVGDVEWSVTVWSNKEVTKDSKELI